MIARTIDQPGCQMTLLAVKAIRGPLTSPEYSFVAVGKVVWLEMVLDCSRDGMTFNDY